MSPPEIEVLFRRLPHCPPELPVPSRASEAAAGYDVRAASAAVIAPGERALIPTGFAIALPRGTEAQVRPRSSLALQHGVTVLNAPGTIDADYRGELGVLLINHGLEAFVIEPGRRIAQLVFAPVAEALWREQARLPPSKRGSGGFGSTGAQ